MNTENVSNPDPTGNHAECLAAVRRARLALLEMLADLHMLYATGKPEADLIAPVCAEVTS